MIDDSTSKIYLDKSGSGAKSSISIIPNSQNISFAFWETIYLLFQGQNIESFTII